MTPAQRAMRARIGAYAVHAAGRTNTGPASAAFLSRFDRQVDPDGTLPPEERARRAALARKAYMTTLSLRASRARTRKAAPASGAPGAALEADGGTRRRPPAA